MTTSSPLPEQNVPTVPSIEDAGSFVRREVADGLLRPDKRLSPWLFYDEEGSKLFERITELPEYYLTRAERAIFDDQADAIVEAVGIDLPLKVIELGSGTATKSQVLLKAVVRAQGRASFTPVDVSASALAQAVHRLKQEEPWVDVNPLVGYHEQAFAQLLALGRRQLVLFIGSSIGNFEDSAALNLLLGIRQHLLPGGALLLGTDLKKSPSILIPAYDDSAQVTAAFNKNILRRINRELDANFDLQAFRHVVVWNEMQSRIEMHLESIRDQIVDINALGCRVHFSHGERIHTESSVKYDLVRARKLLADAGFILERTFYDAEQLFGLHLARVIDQDPRYPS